MKQSLQVCANENSNKKKNVVDSKGMFLAIPFKVSTSVLTAFTFADDSWATALSVSTSQLISLTAVTLSNISTETFWTPRSLKVSLRSKKWLQRKRADSFHFQSGFVGIVSYCLLFDGDLVTFSIL